MPRVKSKLFWSSTMLEVESGVAPSRWNEPSPSGHHSPASALEKRPGVMTVFVHSQMSATRRMEESVLWLESKVLSMKVSETNLSR